MSTKGSCWIHFLTTRGTHDNVPFLIMDGHSIKPQTNIEMSVFARAGALKHCLKMSDDVLGTLSHCLKLSGCACLSDIVFSQICLKMSDLVRGASVPVDR